MTRTTPAVTGHPDRGPRDVDAHAPRPADWAERGVGTGMSAAAASGPLQMLGRLIAAGAGATTAAVGVVAVAGWYGHHSGIVEAFSGRNPLAFNTAVVLVVLGAALAAVALRRPGWAVPPATLVAVAGGLGLAERLSGHGLGIDRLFADILAAGPAEAAERMAPGTATCLLVAAIALLLAATGPGRRKANVVGVAGSAVFAAGLFAVFGYGAGVPAAYRWGHLAGMPLMSAVALALTGFGLVAVACWFVQPDRARMAWTAAPAAAGSLGVVLLIWTFARAIGGSSSTQGDRPSVAAATVMAALVLGVLLAISLLVLGFLGALRLELARRARETRALAEVAGTLSDVGRDDGTSLQEIARRLAAAIGDACLIWQRRADGHGLQLVALGADDPALEASLRPKLPATLDLTIDTPVSRALRTERPVLVGIAAEGKSGPDDGGVGAAIAALVGGDSTLPGASGPFSGVVTAMRPEGDVIGAVALVRCDGDGYSDGEVTIVADVADRTGLAIANTRLHGLMEVSDHRFRSSVEAMLDGFAILSSERDADGEITDFRFEFVNDAAARIVGVAQAELVGRALLDFLDLVEPSGVLRALTAVVETGRPFVRDALDDGRPSHAGRGGRAFDVRAVKLADGLAVSFRDVTTRVSDSDALVHHTHLAEVLAVCSKGFHDLDDEIGAAQMVASAVTDRLGWPCQVWLAEGASLRAAAVDHPDPASVDRVRHIAATPVELHSDQPVARAFRQGCELRGRTDTGATVYMPISVSDQALGVLAVEKPGPAAFEADELDLLNDLAERTALAVDNRRLRRAEAEAAVAVAASEAQFRSAFDHAPVGVVISSADPASPGRFLRVNPAFCQLTGYDERRLLTMDYRKLILPDEVAAEVSGMADATGPDSPTGERRRLLRLRRANGELIWVRVSISALPGDAPPRTIAHVEDVTAQKQAEEDLAHRAMHDQLTGLANRHLAVDHLRMALANLERGAGAVAVLYLDLDHFKRINDTHGHDAGDVVLRQVAGRLLASIRGEDTAARLGGDEFLLVCTMPEEGSSLRIVQRVQRALARPVVVGGEVLDVGASIGLATTRSGSTDPDELIRQADVALYQAKSRGRHRWEIYDQALQDQARQRLSTEQDIRNAVDRGWLRLHYQPIVDLDNRRVVGAEALLRMAHPAKGLLAPAAFIDVAEHSDLIEDIGEWVLAEACRQLAEWRRAGAFQMAVNVSGRELSKAAVTGRVLAAAHAAGVDPADLSLEMTERVLIEGGDSVIRELTALTDAGVSLAIDDFGTGYGSLTYLRRFPVDTVKIDRSFIAGLGLHSHDTAIVEAVVALSRTLNLANVAEGVETETQLAALRALGCSRGQGYFFWRPMPAEELTAIIDVQCGVAEVDAPRVPSTSVPSSHVEE